MTARGTNIYTCIGIRIVQISLMVVNFPSRVLCSTELLLPLSPERFCKMITSTNHKMTEQ